MTWMPLTDLLEEVPPMVMFHRRDLERITFRTRRDRIHPDTRAVIVRRIEDGDSHTEIAEDFDLPPRSIENIARTERRKRIEA